MYPQKILVTQGQYLNIVKMNVRYFRFDLYAYVEFPFGRFSNNNNKRIPPEFNMRKWNVQIYYNIEYWVCFSSYAFILVCGPLHATR